MCNRARDEPAVLSIFRRSHVLFTLLIVVKSDVCEVAVSVDADMARRKMSTVATVSFARTSTVSLKVNFISFQRRRKRGSRLSTKLTVKYDSMIY